MIRDKGYENLLDEVLAEGGLTELEESLRMQCLKDLARKRRPLGRWLLLPAAAALFILMVKAFVWTGHQGGIASLEGPAPVAKLKPYEVSTIPLSKDRLVSTPSSGMNGYAVRTREVGDLMVHTLPPHALVFTKDKPPVERLSDEEMLALFPGTPLALVQKGKDRKALIFFNPEDANRFFGKGGG